MAIIVTLDKLGSFQRSGISTNRLDHAGRAARISGVVNDNTGYQQAVDAILTVPGILFHQNITTLPLASIFVKRYGPTKMKAQLEYYRRYHSVPTQPAATLAAFRDAYRSTKWYSQAADATGQPTFTNGLPSGPVDWLVGSVTDKNAIARHWTFVQTGFKIYVPTSLTYNPATQIEYRRNTINLNPVEFGNFTFPPKTVRFDGLAVDAIEINGGVQYVIKYSFSTFKEGFYYQTLRWIAGGWVTKTLLAHEAIAWPGGFPRHA